MLASAYEPFAVLVLVEEIDEEAIRVRWLYSAAIARVEGSEQEDVIKHIDMDRESEALNQSSSTEEWDRVKEWTEAAEKNDEGPEALEDDVKIFEDLYHHLASMPYDALTSLCVCQAQSVMRGQTAKPDQVWCVD